MHKHSSFVALPEATIQLDSITRLKRYMMAKRPRQRGLEVDRYIVVDDEVRARLKYPDGTQAWAFVGYLEDIARNIQMGFYEEDPSAELSEV